MLFSECRICHAATQKNVIWLLKERFSFDRVYVDHRLNMLCANTGGQDPWQRLFYTLLPLGVLQKCAHDSLNGGREM